MQDDGGGRWESVKGKKKGVGEDDGGLYSVFCCLLVLRKRRWRNGRERSRGRGEEKNVEIN